jgi:hypothetical protein
MFISALFLPITDLILCASSPLQHSITPTFPARCPLSTFGVRRWAFDVFFPLSGVTTPPIHCFARDLLLYCFMTKSRCWAANSRHAEFSNL